MSPRLKRYDTIIDAAEVVVAEVGAAHMTLDAVAGKAGISKGGLLYHFPTKEALLEAMIKSKNWSRYERHFVKRHGTSFRIIRHVN